MTDSEPNFRADIEAINNITVVPTILEVICRTTGMGFAAITRVTEDRWIACSVRDEIKFGLEPGGELKVETTICHEISQSGEAVVIDHVDNDEAFCKHPTPAIYGFQSYISVPIFRKDGSFFGTLCAIDPRPAKLNTPETIGMFKLYADLLSFHLNALEQLALTKTRLLEERKTAELREQFIAILGHDLRNPVSAILNCAQLMLRIAPDERTVRIANIIQDSSFRMKALIENILDFAKGQMGGGINIKRNPNEPMESILNHVISEVHATWPDCIIETNFDLAGPVNCDGKRIAQLFSNVLSNAITHGKKDAPVIVDAISRDNEFKLSVTNFGEKIPAANMERLFKPFFRGALKKGEREGLGLGLYIASEIAIAHGGALDVESTEEKTCFTLRMPTNQPEARA